MMNTVDNHTRLLNPRIRFDRLLDKIAVRFFAKALDVDPGRLKAEPYSREHSDPDGSATDPGDFAGVTNGAPSGLQTEHASVAEQRLNYQPWITATLTAYGESLTGIKAGTVLQWEQAKKRLSGDLWKKLPSGTLLDPEKQVTVWWIDIGGARQRAYLEFCQ